MCEKTYVGSFPTGVSSKRPDGGTIPCCPFCGAPGKLRVYDGGWASVACSNGRCRVHPGTHPHCPSVDAALDDWSPRADQAFAGNGRSIADAAASELLAGCGGRLVGTDAARLGELVLEAVKRAWPRQVGDGVYALLDAAEALAQMLRHVDPSGGERS